MPRRAYFGDVRLPGVLRSVVPDEPRGFTQIHVGVDRTTALVLPTSPNYMTRLMVTTFWDPESDFSKKGFRARETKVREALRSRSEATYPLCWIEDDTKSTTITSFTGNVITTTANPNGFANGDVVLVRRNGTGLYTIGVVSSRDANHITVTAAHAYQNGDGIHLVEKYWAGMIFDALGALAPTGTSDSHAMDATFGFTGTGSSTYDRTSVTLE